MKISYLLIVILTIQHLTAFSQIFEVKDSLQMASDNIIDGQWADINNDGSLNYVALLKKVDSIELGYFSIENDLASYTELFSKKCLDAQFKMADFSQDGQLDILLSMKTIDKHSLEIYVNDDQQDFENIIEIDSVYTYRMLSIDFSRNGSPEILALTENELGELEPKIYAYELKTMEWDTLSVAFSDELTYQEVLNIDINKDGWDDILMAGIDTDDEAVLELYKNGFGEFELAEHNFDYPELLKFSKADIDADGDFDVIFSGKVTGESSLFYYENNIDFFKKRLLEIDPDSVTQTFLADFNSDGLIDIVLQSDSVGIPLNKLMLNDGNLNFTTEEVKMTDYQDFGDWDWDGDLDIVQFTEKEDSIKIFFLKNVTTEGNIGPNNVNEAFVFPQIKKVTIFWDSVQDDHTNQAAITYDMYIKKEVVNITPGFHIDNLNRIVTAHGNQSALTIANYYELEPGIYDYGIQTVDNAFYAGGGGEGNGGSGGGGGDDFFRGQFVICDSIRTHDYIVCGSEELIITANEGKEGAWFSSINGYLGTTDSLTIAIIESEEIYFAIQNSLECEDLEIWSFEVTESGKVDSLPDIWACEGDSLKFEVGNYWKDIQWTSSIKGPIGNLDSIIYKVDQYDTISVRLESFQGCIFEDEFLINISTPQITLSGENYKISKGESVQISASGGLNYEWSPSEGLDNHLIPNPIASPDKSTLYTVEVSDSIGCMALGTVQIIVETNAFIPNLFTPNEDQRNDVLKIYGLEEVNDFSFKIYNRSGSLVFESNDLDEAINKGWDGTKNGKEQPNGVYYWKISGTYKNGNAVYLNGESSGAVHLLR